MGLSWVDRCLILNESNSQVVYEYVGKRNLQSVLDNHEGEAIDSNRRLDICTQVADALCFCHSHKVLHLDVKPANVLLTDDGRTWKLADFGCSRNLTAADVLTPDTPSSCRKNAVGTLLYKAPELLKVFVGIDFFCLIGRTKKD